MNRPTLVGRVGELSRLEAVVDACHRGERAVLFLGGEAGIGKTRLVTELAERARARGTEVLEGGCLDLDVGGVPYAPLVEALTDLVGRLGRSVAQEALGPDARHLGLAVAAEDAHPNELEGQTATLQAVQRVLERLGRRRPVVLVIEDAHWADRSTRDLIAYLVATGSPSPLGLIVTYRRDDVTRGHPLRSFVAELERRPHVGHLVLQPLGRADATALLAALMGRALDPVMVEAIYQRAEGNPFFLEELARAGATGPGEVPPIVSDVLAARVEQLSASSQLVLRAAAVGGRRVGHDRLAAVVTLDEPTLAEALREARAANLITADPETRRYAFRHALLHEAVYAEVLPGERRRYHTMYAEQLVTEWAASNADPGIEGLAELAHHWRAAGRTEEALVATVDAAMAAQAGYAMPEAHRFYELALELWDPAAVAPAGLALTRSDVLAHTADAASRTGAFARAVDLITTAIGELDASTDPTVAGLLRERRGWFLWRAGREDDALAEYRQAVRLVPAEPPSAARARVLAAYADALERSGAPGDARRHAEDAIGIASLVGATLDEGHARHTLGLALEAEGDIDGAIAELHRARLVAERNGDVADVAGTYVHLWRALAEQGRPDDMVRLAIDAAEVCRAAEMEVAALLLDCLAAGFLHQLGRWSEAEERLAVDDANVWGLPEVVSQVVRGLVAVERGALEEASEHLETARCLGAQIHDGRINGLLYRGLAELALWQGRTDEASAAVRMGLGLTGDDEMRARLCSLGLRAAADVADQRRAELGMWDPPSDADELAASLARLDRRALARGAPPASEVRAAVATGDAEWARLLGRPDPGRWAEAVQRWEHLGFPAPAAYARWRWAAAVLAQGRRGEAIPMWSAAREAAAKLGAGSLRRAIEADAARAAIPLVAEGEEPEVGPTVPFGLTARELEVLSLVAAGRTNRQIGAELFISEKTASVHVSRILAKLGARTRAQAAGMAGQLGLAGRPGQGRAAE